jgi:hypothetical protein
MTNLPDSPTILASVPSQSAASAKRIALSLASQLSQVMAELRDLAEVYLDHTREEDLERLDDVLGTLEPAQQLLDEFRAYCEADFLAPGTGMAHVMSDEDRRKPGRRQASMFP